MENQRGPTPANGGASEPLAARFPRFLASRLRAARTAAGMSQGAVAEAMVQRGFSWRQSTVAKSEGADRPVLFSEVAALAHIFQKNLDYFQATADGLDDVIEDLKGRITEADQVYVAMRFQLEETRRRLVNLRVKQEVAHAVARYRAEVDEMNLQQALQALFTRTRLGPLAPSPVYEVLGIDQLELEEVDRQSLRATAEVIAKEHAALSKEEILEESAKMLIETSDYLEGKEVSPDFMEFLRSTDEWPQFAALRLTLLIAERVEDESSGS